MGVAGQPQVQVLAGHDLGAQLREDAAGPLHRREREPRELQQLVGPDERQVTGQDPAADTEPGGVAQQPRAHVLLGQRGVHRGQAAPRLGAVHDVVVHQRERVQQLDGGAGHEHLVVVRGARRPVPPVDERRPQALATRGDQRGNGLPHRPQRGVEVVELGNLGLQELGQKRVDRPRDAVERG